MRIGVDVDGILADFNPAYIHELIAQEGNKFPHLPYDPPTWYYDKLVGYSPKGISQAWKSIKTSGTFWQGLGPYPDAPGFIDFLDELMGSKGHDVYFITNRPGVWAKLQTEEWLSRYGCEVPTVLIAEDKAKAVSLLNLDYYIDDKNENCKAVSEGGVGKCYMLARGWNQEQPGVPRLGSLKEFMSILTAAGAQ